MFAVRKVDSKGRLVLPPAFIGKTVTLDVLSEFEVRVRLVKAARVRPSLAVLVSQITDSNLPEKIDFGASTGEEQL